MLMPTQLKGGLLRRGGLQPKKGQSGANGEKGGNDGDADMPTFAKPAPRGPSLLGLDKLAAAKQKANGGSGPVRPKQLPQSVKVASAAAQAMMG